jgi:hypothetical protein
VQLVTERRVLLAALDAGLLASAPPQVSAPLRARIAAIEAELGVTPQVPQPPSPQLHQPGM